MTSTPPRTGAQGEVVGRQERFVAAIVRRADDPGTRAALRSGLGRPPGRAPRMHAVVVPWLPPGCGRETERAYYTVAALIAAGPRTPSTAREEASSDGGAQAAPAADDSGAASPRPNQDGGRMPPPDGLGGALAVAVRRGVIQERHAEQRLHLLARQRDDGLHRQLPGVVRRLQQHHVPVNWVRLLRDLIDWRQDHDEVAKRWLQAFYRTLHQSGQTDPPVPAQPDDDPPTHRTESEQP